MRSHRDWAAFAWRASSLIKKNSKCFALTDSLPPKRRVGTKGSLSSSINEFEWLSGLDGSVSRPIPQLQHLLSLTLLRAWPPTSAPWLPADTWSHGGGLPGQPSPSSPLPARTLLSPFPFHLGTSQWGLFFCLLLMCVWGSLVNVNFTDQ